MKFLIPFFFFLLLPIDAWAFVPHEYPAIYVHMLSLLYCFVALIIVLWAFIRRGLYKERRWKNLFFAAIFHAIWNANVIIGRIAEAVWIQSSQTTGSAEGWHYFTRTIAIEGSAYFYYIGRFDFILLNIAMVFFYMWLRDHLQDESEGRAMSTAALLPLFPIILTEMAGCAIFIVLSALCLVTSIRLYKRERENVLWKYMVGLAATYFMFSISRSFGHIGRHILVATGNQDIWDALYLDAIGGSLNTFIRFLVATLTLFFIWIYETYLGISEDKRQLKISIVERTGLIEKLERDKAELQELDKMKSAFLANMSHELRTPMNTIIGYTEVLLDKIDGPVNDDQEKSLKKVKESAKHLLSLIDDVLNISRIESAKVGLEIKECRIKDLIESAVRSFEPLIAQKKLTLTREIHDDAAVVYGDEDKIKQVLTNLLSNAVKFTHKGGITITARPSQSAVKPGEAPLSLEICVADTGIGIKEEDIRKIFGKFVQLDFALMRQYEGTGLGLSIAKGLVELHKGNIWVTSKYGEGSRFCFTLPLNKEIFARGILPISDS
jgi:signal transduction histidine kinase